MRPKLIEQEIRDCIKQTSNKTVVFDVTACAEVARRYAEGFAEWVGKAGWLMVSGTDRWLNYDGDKAMRFTTAELLKEYDKFLSKEFPTKHQPK